MAEEEPHSVGIPRKGSGRSNQEETEPRLQTAATRAEPVIDNAYNTDQI